MHLKEFMSSVILEAVSSGVSRHRKDQDFTLDSMCEWLRELGFSDVGRRDLSPDFKNREYDIFIKENPGNIVVIAQYRASRNKYILEMEFSGSTAKGELLNVSLYRIVGKNMIHDELYFAEDDAYEVSAIMDRVEADCKSA